MRKVNLLRCDVARDASMQDLFSELSDTRVALSQAYARFNGITFFPQKPPYLLTIPIYWEIKLYRLQRLL